ncbi:MAG: PAS domain S-box protein, partial [Syntrophomonadaceae bacterium]|nr:PAS domain S-box protein [Syntrophomonadaceae bacterium]
MGEDIAELLKAEKELRHRLAIEQAIAVCSRLLVGPGEADLEKILEIMGKAIGAHSAYISEKRSQGKIFDTTYEWCDAETESKLNYYRILDLVQYLWLAEQVSWGESIIINNTDDIPCAASAEKEILRLINARAMLIVPIYDSLQNVKGSIEFVDRQGPRQWQEADIYCLQVVAEMVGLYWERREAVKQLKESEERFRMLTDTTPALTFVSIGPDQPLAYVNAAFKSLTDLNYETCAAQNPLEMVHPEYRDLVRAIGKAHREGTRPPANPAECQLVAKNDKEQWVVLYTNPIEWEGQPAVIGVTHNITKRRELEKELSRARDELELRVKERTRELKAINQALQMEIEERKQVEANLRKSEIKFEKLAESIPGIIYIADRERLLYINSATEAITGYSREECLKMSSWQMIHPDYWPIMKHNSSERMQGKNCAPYELKIVTKDGQEVWGILSSNRIEYKGRKASVGCILDISERKQMEEEIARSRQLEALGMLAGGIAHDFNNILTVISGNISLIKMLRQVDEDSDITEILHEVEEATIQAQDLTGQLLTFSRGGAPIKESASVQELIKDSTSFILRGSNVRCFFTLPDDLWPVNVDRGQISQVIQNLVLNACQSMPQGGNMIISAANAMLDINSMPAFSTKSYVRISIKDQGIGIDDAILDKIFDPYFSTKTGGHGLGLATAYSIIKKHDGDLKIESEPGIGTTVEIILPAADEIPVLKKRVETERFSGQGNILVMDDEDMIRNTLGRMLRQLGYQPSFARDGKEAISL